LTLLSCLRQRQEEIAINKLLNRFPQLKIGSQNGLSGYNLIRSVSIEKPSVTLKLYAQPDWVADKQEFVLITTSDLLAYAIPFFSNSYRDYWNFEFDNLSLSPKSINTTFEKELNICLDTLNLNDTIGSAWKVVNEIFYSLLHCQQMSIVDSSFFLTVMVGDGNHTMPAENTDSCSKRIRQNWEIISQEMSPNMLVIYKQPLWDGDHKRIYQFDFKGFRQRKKNYFKLKTFRQDCNQYFLTL
jgi:hypothetical protein